MKIHSVQIENEKKSNLQSDKIKNGNHSTKENYNNITINSNSPFLSVRPQLVNVKDIEPFLCTNPYILNGYRVLSSRRQCVASLFQMHNQTGNIWTHLIGGLTIMALLIYDTVWLIPSARTAQLFDYVIMNSSLLCILTCMTASTAYHLLCCTKSSATAFNHHTETTQHQELHNADNFLFWLSVDYTGISVGILGTYIPAISYGFYYHSMWCAVYLVLICGLMFAICYALISVFSRRHLPTCNGGKYIGKEEKGKNCKNQSSVELKAFPLPMATLYVTAIVFSVIPLVHWIQLAGGLHSNEVQVFVPKLLFTYLLGALGLFFYKTKLPERLAPGRFDLIGQSHQLWHVFILAAFIYWHVAAQQLFRLRHKL